GLIIILFFKYIKTKKDLEGIQLNDSSHEITIHSDEEDNNNNNNIGNTNHNNKRASVTINK
ncbi:pH-response regulator protein palI/RIM9, partial [Candida albicans P57055]